jgi:hypothetical protein
MTNVQTANRQTVELSPKVAVHIRDYIKKFDLLPQVEKRTQENWCGVGSRATYYNAISKTLDGTPTKLAEFLMLSEAQNLILEHQKSLSNEAVLPNESKKED